MDFKVHYYCRPPLPKVSRQTLKIMKLIAIILFAACLQVSARGYSQITLSETNTPLQKVFQKIQQQSGYDFVSTYETLNEAGNVTVNVQNVSLQKALEACLRGKPLTYVIIGKTVVVRAEEKTYFKTNTINTMALPPPPIEVHGQVKDENGNGLLNASIVIRGTNKGVTTNSEGYYTIVVPNKNAVLVFSYTGYINQEIQVGNRTNINVNLARANNSLNEVVVTALGRSKAKRGLVYSIQEVKGDEFTQARDNNIASALTGKIAGLDATQINAGPGSSSRVIIRGNNSLSNANGGPNQQPLYVVNGMPINNSNNGASQNTSSLNIDRGDGISMINPDDIESISVLKGGAAAALYGSQAANGVILITTKSGRAQKGIGVEFNSVYNRGTPSVYPNYQYIYGQGQNGTKPTSVAEAQGSGRLSYGPKMDGLPYIQVDGKMHPYSPVNVKENIKNFYRPRTDITNTLALYTGSNSFNMRLSLSDLKSNDQQPNSTYERQTGNLGVMGTLGKNDFITVKSNIQFNQVWGRNRPAVGYATYNAAWPVYLLANTVDIRNLAPGYDSLTGKELAWNLAPEAPNSWFIVNRMGNSDKTQRYIISANVQVNFLKNLFLIAQGQRDFQNYDRSDFVPVGKNSTPFGALNTSNGQDQVTNLQTTLNYSADFLKKFSLNAFIGANQERKSHFSNMVNGINFVVPDFISLSNLTTITTTGPNFRDETKEGTNSLFGSVDFNYDRKVYLSATGRQDWFSVLNPGNNSIFYPSIGTAVILSDILKMPKKINLFKIRANWAQVGSATVGVGTVNNTYSISTSNAYNLPSQDVSITLQNPDLRPLTVTTSEGGFQMQFFGNRIGLDATYYSKVTTNDIVSINISGASGFRGGNVNIGRTTNKGIELMISGTPVRNISGLTWSTNLNYTYNRSRIVQLAPTVSELSLGNGIQGARIVNRVGLPYATVMVKRPLVNDKGIPVYNSISHFPEAEEIAYGVANPPTLFGFSNTISYRNFSLDFLLDGKFGAVAYSNLMFYATRFGLTPATLPGRDNGLKLTGVDQNGNDFNYKWKSQNIQAYYNQLGRGYSALYTYHTDFVKLRRVVLNYNLPIQKWNLKWIQSATIALVGSNLAVLYKDKRLKEAGLDPEFEESTSNAQGTGGVDEPMTRDIGFNLMLRF